MTSTPVDRVAEVCLALAAWENEGGPACDPTPVAALLGWTAYTARFYPSSRRHDYEVLAAYEAYRRRRRGRFDGHDRKLESVLPNPPKVTAPFDVSA